MPKMAKNCWSNTRAPGLRYILVIFLLFYCNDFFWIYSYFFKQIFMLKTESDVKIFAQNS